MKPFESISRYTTFPNDVLDYVMPICSGAEWKIVCAIVRRTLGWNKTTDRISISQLIKDTGLSRQTVVDATASAVETGYILKTPRGNSFEYTLNKDFELNDPIKNSQENRPIENDENIEQSNFLTRNSLISRPKTVKLLDTQNTKENKEINTLFLLKCYEIGGVTKCDNAWQVKKLIEWRDQYGEEKVLRILEYYILQDNRFGVAVSKMSGSIAKWHDDPKPAQKRAAFPKLANAEGDENEKELQY